MKPPELEECLTVEGTCLVMSGYIFLILLKLAAATNLGCKIGLLVTLTFG
jgi:hypothetical protein